jgi:hypothetical protein
MARGQPTTLARYLVVTDHAFMASRKAPTLGETRETPVLDIAAIRRGDVPPDMPTSPVLTDDLAQTMEAPAAPRLQLMDAAETLILQHGFAATEPDEIARTSGQSVEILRAIFPDQAELLRALHERFCSQALRVIVEAAESAVFEHAPAAVCIDRATHALVDVALGRAALVRAVLASGDARMLEGERKWLGTVTTRVARVIDAAEGKPQANDLAFALFLARAIVHEAILTSPHDAELAVAVGNALELDTAALHTHVADAVRAYLATRFSTV